MSDGRKMPMCVFCNEAIDMDQGAMGQKGLDKVLAISSEIKDGLDQLLVNRALPIPIHKRCRQNYLLPKNVKKRKRESDNSSKRSEYKAPIRRFQTDDFDIRNQCVYCGKCIDYSMISKQPLKRRDKIHESRTKDFIHSLQEKCIERSDKWGNEVHVHIQNIGDTVAAEVKYLYACQISFHEGCESLQDPMKRQQGRPKGSVDQEKNEGFL